MSDNVVPLRPSHGYVECPACGEVWVKGRFVIDKASGSVIAYDTDVACASCDHSLGADA